MFDEERPFTIITSTGRTGTIFFAQLLGNLFPEQVESYHERGHSRLINILSNAHLAGLVSHTSLLAAWQRFKQPEFDRRQNPFYIEVSAHLYAAVSALPELWSGLQVVHIVRDPRAYVRSHINWSRHRAKSFVANYLTPFWQPNPFLLREMRLRDWLGMSKFQHFCWIWDFKNRTLASLETSDVRYLRIRFEDFFQSEDQEARLNELLSFIGLPAQESTAQYFSRRVNLTEKKTFPGWQSWSPLQCAHLDQICGDRMRQYGYGLESAWRDRVQIGYEQL